MNLTLTLALCISQFILGFDIFRIQDVWFINDYNWSDQNSTIADTSGSFSSDDHTSSSSNYTQNKQANGITSWSNNSRIEISITGF